MVVVGISATVAVSAIIGRSASTLWALLLLVPACGLFFYADNKVLEEWRSELLAGWITRELDLAALCQSIRANPALPRGTAEGMLMTLPSAGDLVAEQKVLTPTRRAIATASLAIHRGKADELLLKAIASGIVVGAFLAALWMRALVPLLGLATLALLPLVRAWTSRRRWAEYDAEVASCRTQPGFSEADYARVRADLG